MVFTLVPKTHLYRLKKLSETLIKKFFKWDISSLILGSFPKKLCAIQSIPNIVLKLCLGYFELHKVFWGMSPILDY